VPLRVAENPFGSVGPRLPTVVEADEGRRQIGRLEDEPAHRRRVEPFAAARAGGER
jgi:hypothetical protein